MIRLMELSHNHLYNAIKMLSCIHFFRLIELFNMFPGKRSATKQYKFIGEMLELYCLNPISTLDKHGAPNIEALRKQVGNIVNTFKNDEVIQSSISTLS